MLSSTQIATLIDQFVANTDMNHETYVIVQILAEKLTTAAEPSLAAQDGPLRGEIPLVGRATDYA
jgi:hypothetical protein